jgi:hypothetical protein
MPKGRKKKQRRPQVPALSRGDKAIYNVLMVLSPVVGWGCMVLWVEMQNRLAAKPGVMAVSAPKESGILAFVYLFLHVAFFLELKQKKVHLFGRTDITYGPPKWQAAYPIFRKHPKVERKPGEKRKLWRNWTAYIAVWLVILVVLALSFYPRKLWMTDGSVKVYDCTNQLTQVYTPEDIEQLRFETTWRKRGRGFRAQNQAVLQIRLWMEDGREFRFNYQNLNLSEMERLEELEAMVALKESLPDGTVSHLIDKEYPPENVILDNDYTPEEAALLYQLFES